MGHRPGADVGHAEHLEHRRQVRVAADALDAVGHVEDHARPLPGHDAGHEVLERLDHVHVAVDHADGVTAVLEGASDKLDGAGIVGFAILRPEDVDHAGSSGVPPVVNDGHAHHGLRAMSALTSVREAAMLAPA